jgi:hypothetical protein
MIYFKRKAAYPQKRTEETRKQWIKLNEAYTLHLKSIEKSLPKNVQILSRTTFHDAVVKSISRPSKSEVVIALSGGYLQSGYNTLSFYGVKKAWVPDSIIGDTWLYEEVHLSEIAAFDYQVLLVKDEIRIQADDVIATKGLLY